MKKVHEQTKDYPFDVYADTEKIGVETTIINIDYNFDFNKSTEDYIYIWLKNKTIVDIENKENINNRMKLFFIQYGILI